MKSRFCRSGSGVSLTGPSAGYCAADVGTACNPVSLRSAITANGIPAASWPDGTIRNTSDDWDDERQDDLGAQQRTDARAPQQAHAAASSGSTCRRRPSSRTDAAATMAIVTVCIAAKPIITGFVPNASRIGPARNNPRGLTTAQPTIVVVSTFARSFGGIRTVEMVCRLGFTNPFAIPDRRIATE